jgi:RNA-directed DNA polymerase
LKEELRLRFLEIGLEMHPEKTRIVYCRDSNRLLEYKPDSFDFLGFEFKTREAPPGSGEMFFSFLPAVSPSNLRAMRRHIKLS